MFANRRQQCASLAAAGNLQSAHDQTTTAGAKTQSPASRGVQIFPEYLNALGCFQSRSVLTGVAQASLPCQRHRPRHAGLCAKSGWLWPCRGLPYHSSQCRLSQRSSILLSASLPQVHHITLLARSWSKFYTAGIEPPPWCFLVST